MNPYAQTDRRLDLPQDETGERFSTVELGESGSFPASQFRVWTKTPSYLSIVIEGGSGFASHCKPGDTLLFKFHHEGKPEPGECLEASVRRIKKENHGKLSGQVLVVLDVLSAH
jgi:hypothetical protein